MSTKTSTKPTTNGVKNATSKAVKTVEPQTATPPKENATPKKESATPTPGISQMLQMSKPSGKAIVKRLQHAQILADKFEGMSAKYDDLTQFIAGKDAENSSMKFASESGYTFNLTNPTTINKILDLIELEFSQYLEDSENELLNFQIQ